MIRQITGLAEIAAGYDGFVLDLWGVIHDGAEAYPGVADTLAGLAKQTAAFPEVIFTSSQTGEGVPELRAGVVRLLAQMGL